MLRLVEATVTRCETAHCKPIRAETGMGTSAAEEALTDAVRETAEERETGEAPSSFLTKTLVERPQKTEVSSILRDAKGHAQADTPARKTPRSCENHRWSRSQDGHRDIQPDRPQRTRDVETGAPKTRSVEARQEVPWSSAPRGHKRPRSHSAATLTSAPTTATQQRADVSAETGTQTDEPWNVVAEALTSVLATRSELATVQQHLEDTFNFQISSLLTVRGTANSVPQLVDMLGRARKKAR